MGDTYDYEPEPYVKAKWDELERNGGYCADCKHYRVLTRYPLCAYCYGLRQMQLDTKVKKRWEVA